MEQEKRSFTYCFGDRYARALSLALSVSIEAMYGLGVLGQFSNDISIVSLLMFFSAIGWTNLILVWVPPAKEIERFQIIHMLVRNAIPICAIGGVIIGVLGFLGLAFEPGFMILLLIGWSGYQFIRHYLLSLKNYQLLFAIDITNIVITMTLLVLLCNGSDGPYIAMAASLVAITIGMLSYVYSKLARTGFGLDKKRQKAMRIGLEYGIANFMSAGMSLLLAPTTVHILGKPYGGLVGLVTNFLGIILLFPRAISFYYFPELAKLDKLSTQNFFSQYRKFQRFLNLSLLIGTLGALLIVGIAGVLIYSEASSLDSAIWIFFLLLLNTVITQIAVPDSNRLVIKQQSRFMAEINIVAFVMFSGCLAILFWSTTPGLNGFLLLLVAQLLISVGRGVALHRLARRLKYGI